MHVRIQKWGNSLALRIPHHLAREAHLEEGSEVNLTERAGKIIVNPVECDPSLAELLSKITKENLHDAVDFGSTRGKEIW
jgi:antitoxin MazE